MDVNVSVSVIYVEATIYLLLYNLHDCTFKPKLRASQEELLHELG